MNDQGESQYALKRRSGRMMYGPARMPETYPKFQTGRVFVRCAHGKAYNQCCGTKSTDGRVI